MGELTGIARLAVPFLVKVAQFDAVDVVLPSVAPVERGFSTARVREKLARAAGLCCWLASFLCSLPGFGHFLAMFGLCYKLVAKGFRLFATAAFVFLVALLAHPFKISGLDPVKHRSRLQIARPECESKGKYRVPQTLSPDQAFLGLTGYRTVALAVCDQPGGEGNSVDLDRAASVTCYGSSNELLVTGLFGS